MKLMKLMKLMKSMKFAVEVRRNPVEMNWGKCRSKMAVRRFSKIHFYSAVEVLDDNIFTYTVKWPSVETL